MWNSYGLELGWVGLAVLAFGFVLFLADLVQRLRARPLAAAAAEGAEVEAVPDPEH